MRNRHDLVLGKLIFGKDHFLYGLELCLRLAGCEAHRVTAETVKGVDVLLVSMFWYRDVFHFAKFCRDAGISKGGNGPVIIIGGIHAVMNPKLVSTYADYVFIGDADDCLGDLLDQLAATGRIEHENVYREGMERVPLARECEPSAMGVQKGGKGKVLRIEIARGCRYRCKFCAISKLKRYREVDADEIIKLIAESPEKIVSLFAPERTMHSRWPDLWQALEKYGKRDLGQDVRIEHLDRVPGNTATVGIEGMSLKLRRVVGKGWPDDYLLSKMDEFIRRNGRVCMISAYYIGDIPGEDHDDWDAIFNFFEQIEKADFSRYLTFKPVLHPLSPKPFTDLQWAEVHPFRDYRTPWKALLRKGGAGQWGFRCVEMMVWGAFERVMDGLATWGDERAKTVIDAMRGEVLTYRLSDADKELAARAVLERALKAGLTEAQLFGPRDHLRGHALPPVGKDIEVESPALRSE